jgi:hypothetical protein
MSDEIPLVSSCPYCGAEVEGLTLVAGHDAPEQRMEVCICGDCAEVLVIERGHLRKPTLAEMVEVRSHPALERARWAVRIAHSREHN